MFKTQSEKESIEILTNLKHLVLFTEAIAAIYFTLKYSPCSTTMFKHL